VVNKLLWLWTQGWKHTPALLLVIQTPQTSWKLHNSSNAKVGVGMRDYDWPGIVRVSLTVRDADKRHYNMHGLQSVVDRELSEDLWRSGMLWCCTRVCMADDSSGIVRGLSEYLGQSGYSGKG